MIRNVESDIDRMGPVCTYGRLSMEKDAEDASNGSTDVWDESLRPTFN